MFLTQLTGVPDLPARYLKCYCCGRPVAHAELCEVDSQVARMTPSDRERVLHSLGLVRCMAQDLGLFHVPPEETRTQVPLRANLCASCLVEAEKASLEA